MSSQGATSSRAPTLPLNSEEKTSNEHFQAADPKEEETEINEAAPVLIYRKDYRPPSYRISHVELFFIINDDFTRVSPAEIFNSLMFP